MEARRAGVIKRFRDGGAERPLDTGLSLTKSSREGFVGEWAFSFCLDFNFDGTFWTGALSPLEGALFFGFIGFSLGR